VGIGLKGDLAIVCDQAEIGLHLLRGALQTLSAEQHNIDLTVLTSALAEGLRKTGQFEEAFLTINGAIARAKSCGATFDMAELLRIKAQILAVMPQHGREAAMDCLIEALAIATDLARLLSEGGQRDQARRTLSPVYDCFTEGFDTTDLRSARQLLDDLA
jgi:predicted ATPase